MSRTAIVGAGMAGLAAAWKLRQEGHEVVVFEKSRGLSGRAATRRREGASYDHGANFFRTDGHPGIHDLIHHHLPTEDLAEIPGPVWTFEANGTIQSGDPTQNSFAKYTYRNGISSLGKLLVAAATPTVHRSSLITKLTRQADRWQVEDATGNSFGPFDHLILTPPAPQTSALLDTVEGCSDALAPLREYLSGCRFHKQFTFILGFQHRLPRLAPYHALVTSDRLHEIAWLSFEDDKPGHVPPDQSILVVQMDPAWSTAHYDTPREDLYPLALTATRALLPSLPTPDWWDSQRWGFAHPDQSPDTAPSETGAAIGLHLAGDSLVGRGRIPLALQTGLDAAAAILQPTPSAA